MDILLKSVWIAWSDMLKALQTRHRFLTLGWQDVATRYRRSIVGAFWITLEKGVLIASIGLVFGTLFQQPLSIFLPYLALGLIFWAYINTLISAGCTSFIASSGIILQVQMPLFTHILRQVWHEIIILLHNIAIIPILFLVIWKGINLNILLLIPGFIILSLNLLWMMTILAIVCARYRDVTQIVQNVLQVCFYLTPIIWNPQLLPERALGVLLVVNPFFHLLSIVRYPIMGVAPDLFSWVYSIILLIIGWAIALPFYGYYKRRVPYWL